MIDTKELRRLAQEATSGEWYVVRGNHIYGRKKVTDGEEEWHPLIACTDDDEVNVNFEANASFIAAANPSAISELLDRLEAAERERDEFKRACFGHISDNSMLRAKIERMEKQEPVGEIQRANSTGNYNYSVVWVPMAVGSKLYALPGAKGEGK